MNDDQTGPNRDYACAVGSAILALNQVESAVFYLLQILDSTQATLEVEGAFFMDKIKRLENAARLHATSNVCARLNNIVYKARQLADERNNFAHGFLWTDAFTGEHKRRFVRRRDSKVLEGARLSPEMIEGVAFDLIILSADVNDLAMELGGLERWEEYAGDQEQ